MCIVKSLPSLISLTRTWYYAMFIIMCIFCVLNGAIVTHDIKEDLEKTFTAQIDILSQEAQEVIALNYSILDNIVAKLTSSNPENIAKNFAQYTHTIGQYTNNIIFLTSPQKDIIQITPNTNEVSEHFSPENHTQIKIHLTENNNTLLTNHLFIGPILRVHSENTWVIPITKSILKGDKDLGTVVWVAHLQKFSDSLIKSNITLKLKDGHEKRPANCYVQANDKILAAHINTAISYRTILGTILAPKGDILASEGSSLIHGTTRYVTLAMPAKHIQKLFWNKFNYNFIIFFFCTFAILFVVLSKISRLANKVKNVENILIQSAIRLQHLIPGFSTLTSLKPLNRSDTILVNIERFVDANHLIVDKIEKQNDIILTYEKHTPDLQKRFLDSMKALQEQSLCLTEKIDDVYHIATNNLYQDPKKLWAIFEEIYHRSKSYEEYALSLQDSLSKAQAIATCEKRIINISNMIQKTFANKYAYFSVQHSLTGETNLMKALIPEAVEASIDSLLEIGLKEDYHINLKIQPNCTIIEIILDTTEHKLDQDQVQQSLEKARLFALLDEGLIGIYRTENHLVFTLAYNYTDSNPDISADRPAKIRFSKEAQPL